MLELPHSCVQLVGREPENLSISANLTVVEKNGGDCVQQTEGSLEKALFEADTLVPPYSG